MIYIGETVYYQGENATVLSVSEKNNRFRVNIYHGGEEKEVQVYELKKKTFNNNAILINQN